MPYNAFNDARASVEMETGRMKPDHVELARQLLASNIDYKEFLMKVTEKGLDETVKEYKEAGLLE